MASIKRRDDGKWRARYRDSAGNEHARHFARKVDAQRWLDGVASAVLTGTYTDPKASRVTIRDWAATWQAGQLHLKATGRTRAEGIVRKYVVPRWGAILLEDVSHAAVQAWITELVAGGLSASSVQRTHGILSQMLDLAVRDRRLAVNPARGVRMPRKTGQVATVPHRCPGGGLGRRMRALRPGCAVPRLHGAAMGRDGRPACLRRRPAAPAHPRHPVGN